jgi:hypothetical protein
MVLMISSRLPEETQHMEATLTRCILALYNGQWLCAYLRYLERNPDLVIPPKTVETVRMGSVEYSIISSPSPVISPINSSIWQISTEVLRLVEFLELSDSDAAQLKRLAASPISRFKHGTAGPGRNSLELLLTGVDEWQGVRIPPDDGANGLRLRLLAELFNRLFQAIAGLQSRVQRKLNPPTARDRVRVDVGRALVQVDGKAYSVSVRVAILFKHLVEANGQVVSSGDIARAENEKEFRASRIKEQIQYQELKDLVKVSTKGRKGFYIELPPLDEVE